MSGAGYQPRRALIDPCERTDAEPGPPPLPDHEPAVFGVPQFSCHWLAPVGPPTVADLGSASWRPGAMRAPLVARELDRLRAADARWNYLNSIPGARKGAEIGHLVVGPGGVFTINAGRPSSARGLLGGVHHGRNEAERAARLLTAATRTSIRVQALVVPLEAGNGKLRQPTNGVRIVPRTELAGFLRSQPPYLDGETRGRIIGLARLGSTWSAGR